MIDILNINVRYGLDKCIVNIRTGRVLSPPTATLIAQRY